MRLNIGWTISLLTLSWVCSAAAKTRVHHAATGVFEHNDAADSAAYRWRREVRRDMVGFNDEEKDAMLDRHNSLRSVEFASDMMRMDWDTDLEKSAQVWADKCIFGHSPDRQVEKYRYVGENLYAGTNEFDPAHVVQLWYDEKVDYNYDSLRCTPGKMCGHYTQVVWANSRAVGCGVRYCPFLQQASQFGFSKGYNVVCHYGPGGNYVGQKPYIRGFGCSNCPDDAQYCGENLCYRTFLFQSAHTARPMVWVQVLSCVLLLLLQRRA
ncbi:GLIPR1-like protein 1 [Aplysia californica]|uniref:GLIPR1-like protein 1 n=1 Tax=Aplysia californica TaxID=6500 RepID=A0ABM1A923_APLCA|nr:GLIPR1-like protein 1 [Aplysia californica]